MRGLRRRSDGAQPPPAAAKVVELTREFAHPARRARGDSAVADGVAMRTDGDVHAERERRRHRREGIIRSEEDVSLRGVHDRVGAAAAPHRDG